MTDNPFNDDGYDDAMPYATRPKRTVDVWVLVCVVAMLSGGVAWLFGRYVSDQVSPPRTISVLGVTQELVKADVASLHLSLVTRGSSYKQAMTAMEAAKSKLAIFVASNANGTGLLAPTYDVLTVVTIPSTEAKKERNERPSANANANANAGLHANDAIAAFEIHQKVTVLFPKVLPLQAESLQENMKALVEDGIELRDLYVQFQLSQTQKYQDAMSSRAIINALGQAEAIAKTAGVSLLNVQQIDHAYFQVTGLNTVANTQDGRVDLLEANKVLKLAQRVTYTIKDKN